MAGEATGPEIEPPPRRGTGSLGRAVALVGPFLGLIGTVLLFAYLTRNSGSFMTVYNWRTIAVQTVIVATAALGMTLIMIAGGIDLSVGSVVALVCVGMALLVKETHPPHGAWRHVLPRVSLAWAMAGGVLLGGLCGVINGALITGLRVVPFIITLGTLKVFRGLAKWLSGSTSVYVPEDSKAWWFGRVMATEPVPAWL
ncbi:MAG: ABC transporter permease, partial [Planctomycetia bacterium]|nr:ABC transporter permease [Planctomycetia bacterium]